MIQNQLVDLPIDERSAEKIAYNWIRGTIGNIPHVGTPNKLDDVWSVPIHVNYPRLFKDITTGRPLKLRFMSFKNIGEVKIDAIKGLIIDKPTFYQVQHKISEKLTLIQKTVQKALVKVGANYFSELPFPSHMHTPLLDILSWLLVNDKINISVDFEQICEKHLNTTESACFHAQQASEKALKSLLFLKGQRSVLTHSTRELYREVKKVYLFGSVARNDFNEGSDIDIAIIGDFKERFLDRIDRILEMTDLPVEPLCYTEDEFEKMKREGNPFIKEILKGKILFSSK